MRFCNLKTYLSTFRQLIFFHPTIFVPEFVLGFFITTRTFSFCYIASHVCLSRKLLHPFSGVNCYFNLGFCFLTHLNQSHHVVWRPTVLRRCDWVTSFLHFIAKYKTVFSWFVFFRAHLSAYRTGGAIHESGSHIFRSPVCYFRRKVYINTSL